ncbi:MAG: hypothetical protein KDI19_06190 [Pseudomonadales bacterium]|nr:hypothetical protein [Pseudomonadales bacterium]
MDVPLIDIAGLPDDPVAIEGVARACEQWGFFKVTGHGIDDSLVDDFMSAMRTFFEQPEPLRQSVLRSRENPMGYYDRELTKNTPDWKQVFDYGIDLADPGTHVPSRWPALPGFRETMIAWFDACTGVSFRLLGALEVSLDVRPGTLARSFRPVHTSFVRLNYYPPCDDPAPEDSGTVVERGLLGVNRHTDAGALTVLVQDDVASLQVNRDGIWHTVQPDKRALVINAGDMLQVWSNDRFKAAEHRVLARDTAERFSAPYFFNPAFETNCVPLGVSSAEAVYNPVNWGHFRTARADGDYADYGEEIQISQFRKR